MQRILWVLAVMLAALATPQCSGTESGKVKPSLLHGSPGERAKKKPAPIKRPTYYYSYPTPYTQFVMCSLWRPYDPYQVTWLEDPNPINWRYGYWGGPNWSAGTSTASNPPINWNLTGVDTMDAGGFRLHDLYYEQAGNNYTAKGQADDWLVGFLQSLAPEGYQYGSRNSPMGAPCYTFYDTDGNVVYFSEYARQQAITAISIKSSWDYLVGFFSGW
ncbi:MAG: hypothetical protein ABSE73_10415 [Planctomycetota bacterium]